MKRVWTHTALVLALLSSADKALADLRCEEPLPPTLCEEGQKFWSRLESLFGKSPGTGAVSVRLEIPAGGYIRAGLSDQKTIRLHPRASLDSRVGILKHEVAHLYLARQNPEASPFLQEVFALWVSQDDVRISLETSDFFRRKEAIDYLKKREKTDFATGSRDDRALARVLTHLRSQKKESEQVQRLLEESFRGTLSNDEIEERLSAAFQIGAPQAQIDFALWDGAGRMLEFEGRIDEAFPTGSVLKPLLIATEPDFMSPRPSRVHPVWFCPNRKVSPKIWTWQEALSLSCNGFFLDSKKPWDKLLGYRGTLVQLGVKEPGSLVADAIGVVPNQKMSVREVERAFRWLGIKAPFVLEALQDVPVNGTLAKLPDSDWFAKRGLALKSGSMKDEKGEPLHSWIAAVDAKVPAEPRFLAVIHAEGKATSALLPDLRQRIEKTWWESSRTAHVQILGLIPESTIEGECERGPLLEKQKGEWTFSAGANIQSSNSNSFRCLSGPLVVSFSPRAGLPKIKRPYYGILTSKDAPPEFAAVKKIKGKRPLTANQIKARQGSNWVLETSERDYLFEVVASEFANGRKEALKALALVARANLEVGWKKSGEICDTTICQVFGQSDRMGKFQQKKLWSLLHEIQGLNLQNKNNEWLPFSAGGIEPWSEDREAALIQESLALHGELGDIEKRGQNYQVQVGSRKIELSCDDLRLQLSLPSCPETIRRQTSSAGEKTLTFTGRGRGHNRGLSILKANDLAAQGYSFEEILLQTDPTWKIKK
jgi:hypothetical protein